MWSVVTFMINHHGQLLRFALNCLQSSLVPRLLRYKATCNLQKNFMHTDIILLRTNGLITNCDIFFNHTALDLSYMVVLLLVGVARALVMVDSRLCATKCEQCEKDGKTYVKRVGGSERDFKYLTKCEDMVVAQDGHVLSLLH